MLLAGSTRSPSIPNGVLAWFEGDIFKLNLKGKLFDQDKTPVEFPEGATLTLRVLNERREIVKEFECSPDENGNIEINIDEETTALFPWGKYKGQMLFDDGERHVTIGVYEIIVGDIDHHKHNKYAVDAEFMGWISRGIEHAEVVEGHLILTLTDGCIIDLGNVRGDQGVSVNGITIDEKGIFTIVYSDGRTEAIGNDLYTALLNLKDLASTYANDAAVRAQESKDEAYNAWKSANAATKAETDAKASKESAEASANTATAEAGAAAESRRQAGISSDVAAAFANSASAQATASRQSATEAANAASDALENKQRTEEIYESIIDTGYAERLAAVETVNTAQGTELQRLEQDKANKAEVNTAFSSVNSKLSIAQTDIASLKTNKADKKELSDLETEVDTLKDTKAEKTAVESLETRATVLEANKADKTEVAALAALVDTKADKTALDETNRDVEFLKLVTKDVNWTKEEREEEGHATLPKGGLFGNVDEVRGKTEQETTNGYQLVPLPINRTRSENGISSEVFDDGSFHIWGTATQNTAYKFSGEFYVDSDTTYTYSVDAPYIDSSDFFCVYPTDSATSSLPLNNATYNNERTGKVAFTGVARLGIRLAAGTTLDLYGKAMLELGSTAHPYEPYTGGVPMPNPDYPSEIVSMDEIWIEKTGKNLCRNYLNHGLISTIGSSFPQTKKTHKDDELSTRHVVTYVLEKGTYSFSAKDSRAQYYLIKSNDGQNVSSVEGWYNIGTPLVVENYAQVMVKLSDNSSFMFSDIDVQIEYGSVASDYEPYRSEQRTIIPPRPLNAIGNGKYKDKLNVVSGEWEYVTKDAYLNTSNEFSANTLWSSYVLEGYDYNVGRFDLICDKYYSANVTFNKGFNFYVNGQNCFVAYDNRFATKTELNNWLAENPVHIVYFTAVGDSLPIDPADLDYLRNLTLNKGENLFITDNHGRDVSYLMSDFINLREALS